MLISKRSRRKSDLFESRFRGIEGADFPLRQYLRCREDFTSTLVHLVLNGAFAVLLGIFARALYRMFEVHGADLSPWYGRLALAGMTAFILSVVRRMYYKVMELKEIRGEMTRLQAEFRRRESEDSQSADGG